MATQGMGDEGRNELQRGCLILGANPHPRRAHTVFIAPRKAEQARQDHAPGLPRDEH